jgi:putative tryptophan/tyrosine transport system substrate-binding protein
MVRITFTFTHRLLAALMVLGGLGLFGQHQALAQSSPNILLLNSDASVERYQETQDAFVQAIARPVTTVNLGDPKFTPTNLQDIVYDDEPAVIYAIGSKAYLLANQYAPKTPIVFSSIINWLRMPVTRLTYGVSNELHAGMELMLFRYVFPTTQRFAVVYSGDYTEEWFEHARREAREMGLELIGQKISRPNQTIPALHKLLPDSDAFWLISDPLVMSSREDISAILEVCDARQIPVFSYHEAFADLGATMTVTADNPTIGRQAASIARDLLAGNPPEQAVQFPAGTWIVLNLNATNAYHLTYNDEALLGVNRIIE